jgi:hypothetical protein
LRKDRHGDAANIFSAMKRELQTIAAAPPGGIKLKGGDTGSLQRNFY